MENPQLPNVKGSLWNIHSKSQFFSRVLTDIGVPCFFHKGYRHRRGVEKLEILVTINTRVYS